MTRDEVEPQRVCPSLLSWSRYAAEVKAELFSIAVVGEGGAFVVDPIAINAKTLCEALAPAQVVGVVVMNENHARAAAETAAAFAVEIWAHADAWAAVDLPAGRAIADREQFAPGLTAIAIDGAPAGEIAIHAEADGGSLIIGDALINMDAHGFAFLPAKYCRNQKQMRRSLRKLLELDFQRITFAHGLPIVTQAKDRLATLLETGG